MRYSGDPYWITAKYAGNCKCGDHGFEKGDRVYWYPRFKSAYAGECGEIAERDFESMSFDEEMMS